MVIALVHTCYRCRTVADIPSLPAQSHTEKSLAKLKKGKPLIKQASTSNFNAAAGKGMMVDSDYSSASNGAPAGGSDQVSLVTDVSASVH